MERVTVRRILAPLRSDKEPYIRKVLAWIDKDRSKWQKSIPVRVGRMSVESHFAKTEPTVRATYQRLIEFARSFGPVTDDPKKTSIRLVRHAAFAGVATRRSSLILTLKSTSDMRNPRIQKRDRRRLTAGTARTAAGHAPRDAIRLRRDRAGVWRAETRRYHDAS
jgi:hypothetical protein